MSETDVTWAPGHEPGSDNSEYQQQDYFGFQRGERFTFPDGVTFIEIQALNEGKKKEFQDKVSKDLVLEQRTGNARMSVLQGTERHELIKAACVDWNLVRNGKPVPFSKINLNDFLTLGDPKIIENLEKAIRKLNPWLMADMKPEDIQREIDNLTEMLEEAKKREAGEGS